MAAKAYKGGCHCGKVRFEATADLDHVVACNCSICQKHGLMLTFTGEAQFKLVSGEEQLGDYQFNKKVIHHRFCRSCGVEPFARGAKPDGTPMIAINVRCLDGVDASTLSPEPFDGRKL
jgi:hypothetical protein